MRRSPAHDAAGPSDHDVIAIGGGPFNLGLAALASTRSGVDLTVLEAEPELRWHPGLMFEEATLQVNFLADLVSLIDPTHPLSFLAYLRAMDRMYAFYVREQFHPSRREYEDYLRWAVQQLTCVRFDRRVEQVAWDEGAGRFDVLARSADGAARRYAARHLVIGIGTEPYLPPGLAELPKQRCFCAAAFKSREADIERVGHVTLIGSGQTGAEIMLQLLRRNLAGGPAVSWFTRTQSFAPLDYTKLALEMTTPAYVRYFHALPQGLKDRLVAEQWRHYKGISTATIEQIHDLLYQRELVAGLRPVELRCGVAVDAAAVSELGKLRLRCVHLDTGETWSHDTDLVIAATGYRQREPAFLAALGAGVLRDARGRYRVNFDHSIELAPSIGGKIFVAHADLHSHGVAAPDLGIGAYRNALILNTITGRELYRLPGRTAFSRFGPSPSQAALGAGSPGASHGVDEPCLLQRRDETCAPARVAPLDAPPRSANHLE